MKTTLQINEPVELAVRLTHRYNTGWSYLDKRHDLGVGKVEKARTAKWDKRGESFTELLIVDASELKYRDANIARALLSSFDEGCRCEHDCCGHIQRHTRAVRKVAPKRFAVLIGGYRNV